MPQSLTLKSSMLAEVPSCALAGLEGRAVSVEVDIHPGLPRTTVVGLPDASVRESKDRLFAALRNSSFEYPNGRVTVNLAPADLRKAGPAYDLPMALGILIASYQLDTELGDAIAIGEVALDGALRHTHGVLPIAAAAKALGKRRLFLPAVDSAEAALIPGLSVIGARSLKHLVRHLRGRIQIPEAKAPDLDFECAAYSADLGYVRGQAFAKRALEIAAAGGHNLLMTGPPGAGKTMLARCLPSILPPLGIEEALEVTAIHSVAGALPEGVPLVRERPFRSPHHSITPAGLAGGGSWPRPGEISLAHKGVLYLDELPQFGPRTLDILRQPMEDRVVAIVRASGSARYPASFTLAASRNPCPCGFYGDPASECTCSLAAIHRYQARVSGPLLDRIDLHVDVPRVEERELLTDAPAEHSSTVRKRVAAARTRQMERFGVDRPLALSRIRNGEFPTLGSLGASTLRASCNAEMTAREVGRHCRLDAQGLRTLRRAMRSLNLSARAVHRIRKIALTIADLDGVSTIDERHLSEATQYVPRTSP